MCAWKIVALFAVLAAALIVAVVHQGSDGFARGGIVADPIPNSHQQTTPVAPEEYLDTARKTDVEPWGPFRTTDC